jgi:tol-pal system protein YbgF
MPQAQASDASSKQLYETGYGLLLAQDYGAAEGAFEEFLQRFPNDPLAGNAQYWLGETFYVRGQFKPAAAAFLKGYQAYGRSSKAPDSLLKLAMSLDRLGQRDAACSSYGELSIKFPNAPGAVKGRADNERRRLGCA